MKVRAVRIGVPAVLAAATLVAVLNHSLDFESFARQDVDAVFRTTPAGKEIELLTIQRRSQRKALIDEIVKKELEIHQIDEMEKTVQSEVRPQQSYQSYSKLANTAST